MPVRSDRPRRFKLVKNAMPSAPVSRIEKLDHLNAIKVNRVTCNTRRRTIYGSLIRGGIWIAFWLYRSLGRRTIDLPIRSAIA